MVLFMSETSLSSRKSHFISSMLRFAMHSLRLQLIKTETINRDNCCPGLRKDLCFSVIDTLVVRHQQLLLHYSGRGRSTRQSGRHKSQSQSSLVITALLTSLTLLASLASALSHHSFSAHKQISTNLFVETVDPQVILN